MSGIIFPMMPDIIEVQKSVRASIFKRKCQKKIRYTAHIKNGLRFVVT